MFATRHDDPHANLVAQALAEVDADIVALQEIESLDTLKRFNRNQLSDLGYQYAMCIDGNDSRGIDVGILSRLPFLYIRSHQWDERTDRPGEPVFGRDCLEVDVLLPSGRTLTVYINHFKSIAGNLVYVQGKVIKPGPVQMAGPTAVLQALSMSGGLDKFADESEIKVVRGTGASQKILPVRYKDLVSGRDMSTNIQLQAGDTLVVP